MRYPEFMREIHDRLRWAREHAGIASASEAARALKMSSSTYIGHENGRRGITRKAAMRYAHFYHVNPEWLLTGRGTPSMTAVRMMEKRPVLGVLQAKNWQETQGGGPLSETIPMMEDPRFPGLDHYAFKVIGPSFNKIADDGEYVICVALNGKIKSGELVLVERRRGDLFEMTGKRVRIDAKGNVELHAESTTAEYQQVIRPDEKNRQETVRIVARIIGRYSPF